jgi:hypothetical protein
MREHRFQAFADLRSAGAGRRRLMGDLIADPSGGVRSDHMDFRLGQASRPSSREDGNVK